MVSMSSKKKNSMLNRIPAKLWMLLSILAAFLLWIFIASTEAGGVIFAKPWEVVSKLAGKLQDGTLWPHIYISLFRVIAGFLCGFIASVPIAFLMGWYAPFRNLVAPWIQFVRNIPPLAYIPLVIAGAGVGERAKIIVIFIASFLVLVVTIYQGVCNVDVTLIKAAKVLGATDRDIFFQVVIPASTPFILVGARLGLSASLTTLVAAELTGASKGLGMMIQKAQGYYDMAIVLMGILIIGVIGLTFEQIVRYLERKLTGWQETMQQ
ncbi:NitT/TauT family transport system permease protein [[Clostridium] celerecrescens 18A]|uniref:NitT/TauT family transport system permease protein n=2 Tax=Lacrimispora celerecrescens TaxID=29354 RepID=A0A2M8Z957_9FIRM|nr:NitT/TauT family transport system permease protein [[Clostridium] celerecrescens 18A]